VVAGRKAPANGLEKALLASRDPQAVLAAGFIDTQISLTLRVVLDAEERPSLSFGANPAQSYELPELIDNPAPVLHAVNKTAAEMKRALNVTVLTVAGLLRGHVPVKEVGGPIFMAQLASKTAELGAGFFFHLMVWISINLAILNLFPIPLVDGGHLLFLAIEAVKRKPVSLRTRQIAAYVGMSLLGLLFVVVMKNDVQRLIATLTQ
jgi:RIP metalloprotease RseP